MILNREGFDKCILSVTTYKLTTTLDRQSAERLRVSQIALKRAMLEIFLRDRVINQEIRRRTRVTDVISRVAEFKYSCVGHVARQTSEKRTIRFVLWRPKETARSRDRPQRRWIDSIKEDVRQKWRRHEEAYSQKRMAEEEKELCLK